MDKRRFFSTLSCSPSPAPSAQAGLSLSHKQPSHRLGLPVLRISLRRTACCRAGAPRPSGFSRQYAALPAQPPWGRHTSRRRQHERERVLQRGDIGLLGTREGATQPQRPKVSIHHPGAAVSYARHIARTAYVCRGQLCTLCLSSAIKSALHLCMFVLYRCTPVPVSRAQLGAQMRAVLAFTASSSTAFAA